MGLLQKLFKDEDKIVGLCAFKKREKKIYSFTPAFCDTKLVYAADYSKNLFMN